MFARLEGALFLVGMLGAGMLGCDDERRAAPSSAASATTGVAVPLSSSAPPVLAASAPPKAPDAVAAQHILVTYKGAKGADRKITRSKPDAKKRAEEVLTKARSGADFSALVAEYSEDPGSKERQGSVGKFTRDKMTKPFADAAFALAVDHVSDVVESEFGFHVIKRNQ